MNDDSSGQRPPGGRPLNRRQLLGSGVKAGAAALIPLVNSCATPPPPAPVAPPVTPLGADNDKLLTAIANRLVPADESGPGAGTAGVVHYINHSLAEWNQSELPGLKQGLAQFDAVARGRFNSEFAALATERQDSLLTELEAGQLSQVANAQALFNRLYRLVLEGMFSDPYYGGNLDYAGWDLIGYPGAVLASTPDMQKMRVRLAPLHTSGHGSEHDGH